MEDINLDEYNKLCAEFLGWYMEDGVWKVMKDYKGGFIALTKGNELYFESDWNCIMEVVYALEELGKTTIMGRTLKSKFVISTSEIKYLYSHDHNNLLHLTLLPYVVEGGSVNTLYKDNIVEKFDFRNKSKLEAVVYAIYRILTWYKDNKS